MQTESTDWTEFAPIPEDLPELDAETLAAVRELQGGEVEDSTQHLFAAYEPQRRAEESVRLAILHIANGRRDEARHRVVEGRSLLRAYLGHN